MRAETVMAVYNALSDFEKDRLLSMLTKVQPEKQKPVTNHRADIDSLKESILAMPKIKRS